MQPHPIGRRLQAHTTAVNGASAAAAAARRAFIIVAVLTLLGTVRVGEARLEAQHEKGYFSDPGDYAEKILIMRSNFPDYAERNPKLCEIMRFQLMS